MRQTLLLLCCTLMPWAIAPISFAQTPSLKQSPTEASTIDVAALIAHLQTINARMYGAYWCPRGAEQKLLFGDENLLVDSEIYVECAEGGPNRATPWLCSPHRLEIYPTWIINGKDYEGVLSLAQLAEISGFFEVELIEE
ncbi:MAG: hypothetical protein F6J87_05925 [Spirulina sp. SIO3F2]|nr:hypothetical protein [Spirulina sp. SIO3F2]